MISIKRKLKLNPFERLLNINLGDNNNICRILDQHNNVVTKKLKNPYLFTINDLVKLSGLLNIDFYTLTSIIIQNPSFMHAHEQDIDKYFSYLRKEVEEKVVESDVIVSKDSIWRLIDINYKEKSILKLFERHYL